MRGTRIGATLAGASAAVQAIAQARLYNMHPTGKITIQITGNETNLPYSVAPPVNFFWKSA